MQVVEKISTKVAKKAAKQAAHMHAYDAAKWAVRKTAKKLCLGVPKGTVLRGSALDRMIIDAIVFIF